jgi:hypothetical protein
MYIQTRSKIEKKEKEKKTINNNILFSLPIKLLFFPKRRKRKLKCSYKNFTQKNKIEFFYFFFKSLMVIDHL